MTLNVLTKARPSSYILVLCRSISKAECFHVPYHIKINHTSDSTKDYLFICFYIGPSLVWSVTGLVVTDAH